MINNFKELLENVKKFPAKTIAVASAGDIDVINSAMKAYELNLANFILIGSKSKINEIAELNGKKIEFEIVDEPDHKKAADKAVALVKEGKASAIMKGLLHTGLFLKSVLDKEKGLNTGRQITQVSVFEKESNNGFQMLTDCAITIQPDLSQKIKIIENVVELAKKLGYEKPKVALLSAIETVNPAMQDTIEAASISKMADRGQIKGAIVDGPFALDNAISEEAALHKNIDSPVAGKADIIIAPNLQVGNALTKSLTYYAHKDVASAVLGASVPIIMTSRTDSVMNKVLTIALATYIS